MKKSTLVLAMLITVSAFVWFAPVTQAQRGPSPNLCSCEFCESVPHWVQCYSPGAQASGSCGLWAWAFCPQFPDFASSIFPPELMSPKTLPSEATLPAAAVSKVAVRAAPKHVS